MPVPTRAEDREARALALLRELGADRLDHPGGTLLAHLERVRAQLGAWGARPELCLAGLCHASYGTDGFATALMPVGRRAELAAVIGAEAEEIVYLYAGCDRSASYPVLAADDGTEPSTVAFRDRFTGRFHSPNGSRGGTSPSCPPRTNWTSPGSTRRSAQPTGPTSSPCSPGCGVC